MSVCFAYTRTGQSLTEFSAYLASVTRLRRTSPPPAFPVGPKDAVIATGTQRRRTSVLTRLGPQPSKAWERQQARDRTSVSPRNLSESGKAAPMRAGAAKGCRNRARMRGARASGSWCGRAGAHAVVPRCGQAERELHAPIRSRPSGREHDLVSEAGLLLQVIERGMAGSCGFASSPGAWRPVRAGWSSRWGAPLLRRPRSLSLAQQVVGAGEELTGDRRGRDLLAAALRQPAQAPA